PHFVLDEGLPDIRAVCQHLVDEVIGFEQRRIGDFLRAEDREALGIDVLLVERAETERLLNILRHFRHPCGAFSNGRGLLGSGDAAWIAWYRRPTDPT